MTSTEKRIVMISDGTGETLSTIMKAALVQFKDQNITYTRYKNVRTRAQVNAICDTAAVNNELVVYTIVTPDLREYMHEVTKEKSIPNIDILGPLLAGLASYFGRAPLEVAGLLHGVNEEYFKRIDAMEYTIAHDDGRDLTGLDQADLVILGISRTSKTPISMYLSHHGWRIANIPIVLDFQIPDIVYQLNPKKVIGLTIDTQELARIRRARLQRLGQQHGGDYANIDKVSQEMEYANELFRKNRKWAVFNVTGKALEETASEIFKLMASRNMIPPHVTQHLGASGN